MDTMLNWPAVALILGLVAIIMFRAPLMRLIDRTTKFGKDGASFDRPQDGAEANPGQHSFAELMKHPVSASVLQREQAIQSEIAQLKLSDQEKLTILFRGVALTRLELEFNNVAHVIFGSQVALLVQLSSTRQGVQRPQAETIYAEAQKAYSDLYTERNFDDWFNYLKAANLVTIDGDRIDITPYGTDFLKHLVEARLAYNRHG